MPLPETETTSQRLAYTTSPLWAAQQVQRGAAAELLLDQAHLEKKAAAGAVTFLFRVPFPGRWQRGLSALAREELVHFERTLKLLDRRGIPFAAQASTAYPGELKHGIARDMPVKLVDELLTAAIIEARSCERMQLLAAAFADADPELAAFYHYLVEAEARHEVLYCEIARAVARDVDVAARWQCLTAHEAAVLGALPFAARLHSGDRDCGAENAPSEQRLDDSAGS